MTNAPRYYYMDSMRSILILLGVLLHAANLYSVSGNWVVSDPSQSVLFNTIGWTIHLFRMPAFFIIAGFFALMTLEKYGSRTFLKSRFKRIVVPLFSTALVLNSFENYLRHVHRSEVPLTPGGFFRTELPATWWNGQWVSHLWFLNNLLAYFAVCVLLAKVGNRLAAHRLFLAVVSFLRRDVRFLIIAPVLPILCASLGKACPQVLHQSFAFGALQPLELLEYLPYFLFGMWLYRDHTLQAEFSVIRRWQIWAFVPAVSTCLLFSDLTGSIWHGSIALYAESLAAWLSSLFCFCFFKTFLDRRSKLFRYLADASYSIYLFHHLWVILLGGYLVTSSLNVYVKYVTVVSLTFAATLAIHHFVVARIGLFRLMFNGK